MDPYKHLFISLNANGSLSRHLPVPTVPATPENVPVRSKDIPLNPCHSTSLRIFLPPSLPSSSSKLPIILYFHGGGFIVFSAATSVFHSSCSQRALNIPAIVVSVDYRLAPEHRLPAAYDDAVDALLWLRDQSRSVTNSDPWLRDHADFSQCFIMGTSAGANIAYHLGLRSLRLDLEPLRFAGLILNQPFFGGEERTESEARSTEDKILPLAAGDLMWELSLPKGADREHEYCNPMARIAESRGLPRCLVKGFVGDPLYDRQKVFVKGMKEEGMVVVVVMEEEGYHGIEMLDPSKEEGLVADCKKFVHGHDHDTSGKK